MPPKCFFIVNIPTKPDIIVPANFIFSFANKSEVHFTTASMTVSKEPSLFALISKRKKALGLIACDAAFTNSIVFFMQMENNSLKALRDKYSCANLDSLSNTYPVEVDKICSYLGIEVLYTPISDDISGRIYTQDDKYLIEVNLRHVNTRRRFTVAHELGHYCLHKDFLDNVGMILERSVRSTVIRDKEIEADNFAAELLMPKLHFNDKYNELKDVFVLSKYFYVSEAAVRNRIRNLLLKSL